MYLLALLWLALVAQDNRRFPPRYLDRQERLHLSFETALEFARAFCMAEPATALTDVEATERQ